MGMFDLAEPQRPGQGVDGGGRRVHRAPLFQAHVPVDADAGELGHLLAPQSRTAAAPAGGKADTFG